MPLAIRATAGNLQRPDTNDLSLEIGHIIDASGLAALEIDKNHCFKGPEVSRKWLK